MPNQTIVIPAESPPERIDVFLSRHTDLSRSQLQKHIKSSAIKLNDKSTKPHHLVHPGDIVTLSELDLTYHKKPLTPDTNEPLILDEDDNYLVVNKPAGWVVHGGPGIHEDTLADWAVARDPRIGDVGDQPSVRPGIVHRLDRDVSGVMVIAKTQSAFADLKIQFQAHRVTKKYIALVYGFLTKETGKIDFAIARKPDHSGLMVARPRSTEGKNAETHFRVLKTLKGMSLVQVETLTGRTHQIRVHFKAIGHALVGDKLYRQRKLRIDKTSPPRLCLHAAILRFSDLSGRERKYEAPLPVDLQQFFSRLGG